MDARPETDTRPWSEFAQEFAEQQGLASVGSVQVQISRILRERGAVGFWARSVAEHYQQQGLVRVLPIKVPIDLPPVGLMSLRGRLRTPASEQMMDCLRQAAGR